MYLHESRFVQVIAPILDRPAGSRYKLSEIREMVKEEERSLTAEQKEQAVKDLLQHRETRHTGVRANNAAAARDALSSVEKITKELDALFERTGMCSTLFITRSHVNDTFHTSWFATNNDGLDFWEDVMHLRPDDISRHYEQSACAIGKNLAQRDSLENMQKEAIKYINTGLNFTTGKTIRMNYSNYDVGIVETHKVKLIGWPDGVPFITPSNIGTVGEVRKLRDALKSGTCHWKCLTQQESSLHAEELQQRRKAGEVVGTTRKARSDAGTARSSKRKAAGPDRNKENQRTKKKSKAAASQSHPKRTMYKSAETVESSDEDDDDEESDTEEPETTHQK
ncbi:hypothetical protein BJ138DRAFT_1119287 [Hygrophoropsis aurantiaca]|uniref:Uncharacterized protein n=1 Tax=Hygrophoropsis aurantiaca TaxID=72124 RepID=A0ACB7ZV63_9AGAM|nr:hypothetical protein BJ138DRAFT_1119287 [Hygrophoropsis aurantiaca]